MVDTPPAQPNLENGSRSRERGWLIALPEHMVHGTEILARRYERAQVRRDQVLNAAEQCFLAQGFHATSMARVAEAAQMSVGHIYQYFDNKEAIIIALCERRFEHFEDLLSAIDPAHISDPTALIDAWISQFAWWIDPSRAPLTLEIMSEAGRNATIAAVVQKNDRRFRDIMRKALVPLVKPIPRAEIEARLEAVIMLSHGMTVRATADPEVTSREVLAAFRLAFHELFAIETDHGREITR